MDTSDPDNNYRNNLFINDDGIVEIHLIGPQSEASFHHSYMEVVPLIEKLKSEGKPLYGLIDMSQEVSYSLESNKAALDILEKVEYDKLAMCNVPHAGVAHGLIMAIGQGDKIKIFSNRDDALAWLHASM